MASERVLVLNSFTLETSMRGNSRMTDIVERESSIGSTETGMRDNFNSGKTMGVVYTTMLTGRCMKEDIPKV